MKKLYNFKVETNLLKQIDEIEVSRISNDSNPLQTYINTHENNSIENVYNVKLIDLLQSQIADLKEDNRTGWIITSHHGIKGYYYQDINKNNKKQEIKGS